MVANKEMILRFASETVATLNENNENPIAGVILVIGFFVAIWVFSLIRKNPP